MKDSKVTGHSMNKSPTVDVKATESHQSSAAYRKLNSGGAAKPIIQENSLPIQKLQKHVAIPKAQLESASLENSIATAEDLVQSRGAKSS